MRIVGAKVGGGVGVGVGSSVGKGVGEGVGDGVGARVGGSVWHGSQESKVWFSTVDHDPVELECQSKPR